MAEPTAYFTLPPPGYEVEVSRASSLKGSTAGSESTLSRSSYSSSDEISLDRYSASESEIGDDQNEALPSYTSAFQKTDVLQMKPELVTPFCRATRRNWRTVQLEVNNTMLSLRQSTFYGTVTKTESYSLQFAEVGLASDYSKRQHVFRLRVESKQFVFACYNRQQMLAWMVGLQMAISLALPLELRQLPEEVKRRRNIHRERERRRNREWQRASRERQREEEERRRQDVEEEEQISEEIQETRRVEARAELRQKDSNEDLQLQRTRSSDESKRGSRKNESCKWQPRRHQSRFSEKDFPHLTVDTTWEGKSIIYEGQWALVQNRKIIIVEAEAQT